MSREFRPGHEAIAGKGWLAAHKWLLLRRASQLFVIGLFLVGPLTGFWIVKGSLASSMTLNTLPLSDPFIIAQSILAGHVPEKTALIGAAIVIAFYMLVGGRVYCSWVCPVNIVTDAAHWLRRRMDLRGGVRFSRGTRYWVMAMALVAALATGVIVWELVNPVTILFRGLVFGMGAAWVVALAVFLFDLFVGGRGWCGHLCPVGAFYSLLGRVSLLRVKAGNREACDDCMDCFAVCPEPHVIAPALRGANRGTGPVILAPNCTNCGRCIDVCAPNVFAFTTRFDGKVDSHGGCNPQCSNRRSPEKGTFRPVRTGRRPSQGKSRLNPAIHGGSVMKKIITMTMGGLALTLAMLVLQTPASADKVTSLRGYNSIPTDVSAPKLFKTEEPDKAFARAFKGAPPLISHKVDFNDKKYKITVKNNGCLDCHDKSVSDKPKAPKANKGHYTGPNGVIGDEIYNARYYCALCHVPQLQTKPLVGNTFVGSK